MIPQKTLRLLTSNKYIDNALKLKEFILTSMLVLIFLYNYFISYDLYIIYKNEKNILPDSVVEVCKNLISKTCQQIYPYTNSKDRLILTIKNTSDLKINDLKITINGINKVADIKITSDSRELGKSSYKHKNNSLNLNTPKTLLVNESLYINVWGDLIYAGINASSSTNNIKIDSSQEIGGISRFIYNHTKDLIVLVLLFMLIIGIGRIKND